jgi:hypothetical protein
MDENPAQEQVEATAATAKTTNVRPIFFITRKPFCCSFMKYDTPAAGLLEDNLENLGDRHWPWRRGYNEQPGGLYTGKKR